MPAIPYPVWSRRKVCPSLSLSPFEGLINSVSGADIARIMPWNGHYQTIKRCLLHDEKVVIIINYWFSTICTRPWFFANLQPKESPPANPRKINGVEQKTQTENRRMQGVREYLFGCPAQAKVETMILDRQQQSCYSSHSPQNFRRTHIYNSICTDGMTERLSVLCRMYGLTYDIRLQWHGTPHITTKGAALTAAPFLWWRNILMKILIISARLLPFSEYLLHICHSIPGSCQ